MCGASVVPFTHLVLTEDGEGVVLRVPYPEEASQVCRAGLGRVLVEVACTECMECRGRALPPEAEVEQANGEQGVTTGVKKVGLGCEDTHL